MSALGHSKFKRILNGLLGSKVQAIYPDLADLAEFDIFFKKSFFHAIANMDRILAAYGSDIPNINTLLG